MKKVLHIAFPIILLCVYTVSTMGFGIHQCSTDRTTKILLLVGENPCSHTHHHNGVCECGHPHHHDASCCNTKVYVVDAPSTAGHTVVTPPASVTDMARLYCSLTEGSLYCPEGINSLYSLPLPPCLDGDASRAPQGACVSLRL